MAVRIVRRWAETSFLALTAIAVTLFRNFQSSEIGEETLYLRHQWGLKTFVSGIDEVRQTSVGMRNLTELFWGPINSVFKLIVRDDYFAYVGTSIFRLFIPMYVVLRVVRNFSSSKSIQLASVLVSFSSFYLILYGPEKYPQTFGLVIVVGLCLEYLIRLSESWEKVGLMTHLTYIAFICFGSLSLLVNLIHAAAALSTVVPFIFISKQFGARTYRSATAISFWVFFPSLILILMLGQVIMKDLELARQLVGGFTSLRSPLSGIFQIGRGSWIEYDGDLEFGAYVPYIKIFDNYIVKWSRYFLVFFCLISACKSFLGKTDKLVAVLTVTFVGYSALASGSTTFRFIEWESLQQVDLVAAFREPWVKFSPISVIFFAILFAKVTDDFLQKVKINELFGRILIGLAFLGSVPILMSAGRLPQSEPFLSSRLLVRDDWNNLSFFVQQVDRIPSDLEICLAPPTSYSQRKLARFVVARVGRRLSGELPTYPPGFVLGGDPKSDCSKPFARIEFVQPSSNDVECIIGVTSLKRSVDQVALVKEGC